MAILFRHLGCPTEGKAYTRAWARGATTTRPERGETEHPGEGPAEQHIFELKRPVEANKSDAAGIDAPNKTRKTWPHQNRSVKQQRQQRQPRTLGHTSCRPIPPSLFEEHNSATSPQQNRDSDRRTNDTRLTQATAIATTKSWNLPTLVQVALHQTNSKQKPTNNNGSYLGRQRPQLNRVILPGTRILSYDFARAWRDLIQLCESATVPAWYPFLYRQHITFVASTQATKSYSR